MKTIYFLIDPRTSAIRYVGVTKRALQSRLSSHVGDARRLDTHTARWIKSLLDVGLRPKITALEETIDDDWAERERYWINRLRQEGHNLTNHHEGGHHSGPRNPNGKAVSERMKGNQYARGPQSAETREKKSRAWKGRTNNPGLGGWNKGMKRIRLADGSIQYVKV